MAEVALISRIVDAEVLDALVDLVDATSGMIPDGLRGLLGGDWLGHPLHPMLTDLPIGFWTVGTVLDVVAGRRAVPLARRLLGLGVLSVVPATLAGFEEFHRLEGDRVRRLAAVHDAGNAVATALFAVSWWSRRRHRLRGIAWSTFASTVATGAGYLGGQIAFAPPVDHDEHPGTGQSDTVTLTAEGVTGGGLPDPVESTDGESIG